MSETPIQAKDEQDWRSHPCPVFVECGVAICGPAGPNAHLSVNYTSAMHAFDRLEKHLKTCKICTPKQPHHTGNGTYSGPWAFTLTMSPKDAKTIGDMLIAVRKVMRQKSCPVVKYAWYYEDKGRDVNGDAIHPHIHGMYETVSGGRIEAKHWKRAWDIWDEKKPIGTGFRGGYHRPVRNSEKYSDYMKKDGGMSEHWPVERTE